MLISKEQPWRSPAKKLKRTEQQDYVAGRKKTRSKEKLKLIFVKSSKGLKRMILREQENVFLFEFGVTVPVVLKCLF